MPLTTHETRHTARTYTQQTFRTTIVWRPSDGTHNSRPILHGKDYALSRTIRDDRQERASNTVSALMPLMTLETRHTANDAARLNTIIAPKVILNKTSRRNNTVLK